MDGTLYGTTYQGGGSGCYTFGCGTVYSITTSGAEKVLYAFKGSSDGTQPLAGLIDVNGTLYGTTFLGGAKCATDLGCGTVFSVTTSGQETVLHRFGAGGDGYNPEAGLIEMSGTLYGTTFYGGHGPGTVYSITTSGTEQVLYGFAGGSDGANPVRALIDVNGTLYGSTSDGGNHDRGTVFALTP